MTGQKRLLGMGLSAAALLTVGIVAANAAEKSSQRTYANTLRALHDAQQFPLASETL